MTKWKTFPRKGFNSFVSELQSTSNDDDNEDDDDGPTKLGAGGCVSGVEGRVKKLVSKDRRRLGCNDGDWMLTRMKRRALLAWRKTRFMMMSQPMELEMEMTSSNTSLYR